MQSNLVALKVTVKVITPLSRMIFFMDCRNEQPVIYYKSRVAVVLWMEDIFMSKYEFSLQQEILLEKGAAVLGDLFRYKRQNKIIEKTHPISVMYSLVWSAKQDILLAASESDLAEIEGQFNLASRFLAGVEAHANA